jgi:hypothetical protein
VRVALVIGQLHPGGSERQLYELARGLSGGPCEPLVYCLSETVEPFGGALRSQGIPVRVVPRRRRFELRRVRALAKLLREDRIDVINSFSQHVNLYAYLAARRARGVPLVTSNRFDRAAARPACGAMRRRLRLPPQPVGRGELERRKRVHPIDVCRPTRQNRGDSQRRGSEALRSCGRFPGRSARSWGFPPPLRWREWWEGCPPRSASISS